MRIYDLDKNLDKIVGDDNYQVQFIGENSFWTYELYSREWNDDLQRCEYVLITTGTCTNFLMAYDSVAGEITLNEVTRKGLTKLE